MEAHKYYSGMLAGFGQNVGDAPILPTTDLLGHSADFRKDTLGILLRARRELGPLVRMRIGPFYFHLLSDPTAAYAMFVEKHRSYSKRTPGYRTLKTALGNGLVTSEGELWRKQRRIAQPAFRRGEIESLTETMRDAARDQVAAWNRRPDGSEVDVSSAMSQVTLRIAGETLFGVDLSDDSQEVSQSLSLMMEGFATLATTIFPALQHIPTPQNLRVRRAVEHFNQVVDEIIQEHREQSEEEQAGERMTLLKMLMAAEYEDGQKMGDQQLRDEVLTILLAGHETTATSLYWTLYLLSKHPDVARKLQAEVDSVLDGEPPSMAMLSELPYTTQVIKESMRIFPPVWTLARRCEEAQEVCGYHVPAGGLVLCSPYVLHRDPNVWENPEGFDPERFAADKPAPPRGSYMPFLVGPRKCIGEHFAMVEAAILLSTFVHHYSFSLVPGHKVETETSVTLRAKNGIVMQLKRRR